MATITLPVVFSNADAELRALVPVMLRGLYDDRIAERVWKAYTTRGVTQLFMTGSSSGLSENLQKAAYAAIHHVASRGIDSITLSRLPFFQAVASGNELLARQMAWGCRESAHQPEREYLDDYLYVKTLMALTAGERDTATAHQEQLLDLCDGEETSQLAVCRALASLDAAGLEAALAARLEEHEERTSLLLKRGALTEEDWINAQLSIEGLAIVRVAQRLGLRIADNYKFVPSIVVRWTAEPETDASWQDV